MNFKWFRVKFWCREVFKGLDAYLKQLTCLKVWLSGMNLRGLKSVQVRPLTQWSRAKSLTNEKKKAVKRRSSKTRNPCETHYTHFQAFIVLSFKDQSTPFNCNEKFLTVTIELCGPPLSQLFSGTCRYVPSLPSWRDEVITYIFSSIGSTELLVWTWWNWISVLPRKISSWK